MELTIGEVLKTVSDKQKYLREISCGEGEVPSQMLSIPRSSFTASRLSHITSSELSSRSEVTLLGGIPQQWFNERKSFFWGTVRRVKSRRHRQFVEVLTKFTCKPSSGDVNSHQNSLQFAHPSLSPTSLRTISFEDKLEEGSAGQSIETCPSSCPETKGQLCCQISRTKYVVKGPIRYTDPHCSQKPTKEGIDTLYDDLPRQTKTHLLNILTSTVGGTKKLNLKNELHGNDMHLTTSSYLSPQDKKPGNYGDQVSTSIFSGPMVGSALGESNAFGSMRAVPLRYLDPEPTDLDSTLTAGLDSSYEEDNVRKRFYLDKIKSVQSRIELNSSIYLARKNFRGSTVSLEKDIGNIVLMEKLLVMTTVTLAPNHMFPNITSKSCDNGKIVRPWKEYLAIVAEIEGDSGLLMLQFLCPRRRTGSRGDKSTITDMKYVKCLDMLLHHNCPINYQRLTDKTINLSCPYFRTGITPKVPLEHQNFVGRVKSTILRFTTAESCRKWYDFLQQRIHPTRVRCDRISIELLPSSLTISVRFPVGLVQRLDNMKEIESKYLDIGCQERGYRSLPSPGRRYIVVCVLRSLKNRWYSNCLDHREKREIPFLYTSTDYDSDRELQGTRTEVTEGNTSNDAQDSLYKVPPAVLTCNQVKPNIAPSRITSFEGFLHLLTNRYGEDRTIFGGSALRLTFLFTVDNLLFLTRSYKAIPLLPANVKTDKNGLPLDYDEALDAVRRLPSSFFQSPYPLDPQGHIRWLSVDMDPCTFEQMDLRAQTSFNRKVEGILESDYVLDICSIERVYMCDCTDIASSSLKCQALQSAISTSWAREVTVKEAVSSVFALDLTNGVTIKLFAPSSDVAQKWVEKLWALRELSIEKNPAILDHGRQDDTLSLQRIRDISIEPHIISEFDPVRASSEPIRVRLHPLKYSSCHTIIYKGHLYERRNEHCISLRYLGVLIPGYVVLYSISDTSKATGRNKKCRLVPLLDCYMHIGGSPEIGFSDDGYVTDATTIRNERFPRVYSDGLKNNESVSCRCFSLHFVCGKYNRRYRNNLMGFDDQSEPRVSLNDPNNDDFVERKLKRSSFQYEFKFARRVTMAFTVRSKQERDIWVSAITAELERLNKNVP